ncbi:MAG: glycolate oxidase subunit GlcE [Candidatus Sedimenticola sp. (ex Thyasira tokunagai)]
MTDITRSLVEHVREAFEKGSPLNIVGGGSKAYLGREARGEPLQVNDHRGIVSYNPTELVMTARNGTPIEEINRVLAENGQVCPFESPVFEGTATLGGTLAANLSGPARPWSGSIRDAVLGVQLINGKGEQLKFGGQVMKNVAGYDVSRLQAGALGTLGVITEVSFKVVPQAAATTTLVREMSVGDAIKEMNRLAGEPLPISGSVWLNGRLYLRFEGASRAVSAAASKVSGETLDDAQAFWQGVNEQTLDFFQDDTPLWRFSINSSASLAPLNGAWLIDWGGAQRWVRGDFERGVLERYAEEARGHLSLYRHGDRKGEVFHTLSTVQQQMHKNLKASFDPKAVLNPGRLYSWL